MNYNTQQKKMLLPEYGRSIQNMVNYCCTIAERSERQRCANTIVSIMGNMFPHFKEPDSKHILWDHLAIMSDFKLDVDYPYEVIRPEKLMTRPDRIAYPQKNIRFRHYGQIIVQLIKKACELEEGEERDDLTALAFNRMHKLYTQWNKDNVDDQLIERDLEDFSNGKLHVTDNVRKMIQMRNATFGRSVSPERERRNAPKSNQKNRKNYKK